MAKTYDPDQIDMIFVGIPVGGYADGEFVTIEQDEDSFLQVTGTDGQTTRSKNGNRNCTVTFKLMQSSATNPLLSALHALDNLSAGGAGVGPILIRDKQGTTLFASDQAWIKKPPSQSFDKQATAREWVVAVANPSNFIGGN